MTFAVEPGEVVAIAGPSGCGKSTLLSVLLGLAPSGPARSAWGRRTWPTSTPTPGGPRLAWVPQRPHLFARSIADNVRLGRPDATDDAVRAAIADAGLDEVVARLPDGIETILGHEGAGLSAGERQRVALARAFVRDAPLLLLDEPTANLDGRTEENVLAAVRRLMAGRTVVIVAHRPSLLALADRVVHLAPAPSRWPPVNGRRAPAARTRRARRWAAPWASPGPAGAGWCSPPSWGRAPSPPTSG